MSMNNLEDIISGLERQSSPFRALIGQNGWLFLINDRNETLRRQYGLLQWCQDDYLAAISVLERREARLRDLGALYYDFSTPEKCAVYKDYLPSPLCNAPVARRPIDLISEQLTFVNDLQPRIVLSSARSRVFFRGDSHLNWLGSYEVYRGIYDIISHNINLGPALCWDELAINPAGYDGDLYEMLPPHFQARVDELAGSERGPCTLELTTQIRPKTPRAHVVSSPHYLSSLCERETITTENEDKRLPRAVVSRDSSAQFVIPLLAEHFSRCVFYWHQGAVFEDVVESERPDVFIKIYGERVSSSFPTAHATALLKGRP